MKCLKFFIFLCILTFTVSCGQQKRYIQYKVKKGETMSEIAEKLAMKTANLKHLNPDVNGEPKANTFLVVPQKNLNNLKKGMVSIFCSYIWKKRSIIVKGSLNRFRNFTYIDDCAEILTKALIPFRFK